MAITTAEDLETFLAELIADPRLVHVERIPARPARFAELARPLPAVVRERLAIDGFWTHQAQAIDLARAGTSVAVATGTASGKSLCYQAPIAESIVEGLRPATALLLFPTKALAQDQLRAVTELEVPRLVAATYDGDCTTEERTWVRGHANVVLTNPEMLHHGILPNHARWATTLMRLRYVVVDELHLLRGIFGSHVAHLLRRLRRICRHYGSDPTFVFSSATIGEPGRLASELCGLDVAEVTDDGSPHGERLFALWNPSAEPALDIRDRPLGAAATIADGERDLPTTVKRASANHETATLVARLVRSGHRSIAFCRSRKGAEVVAAHTTRHLPAELAELVRPYRAGYLTAERREIEADLFAGRLRGVIATTALELGVDIGGLDACVLNGFPGTIASMWQQAGRAGRAAQQSLAVLVAGDDQLDQWYMNHPDQVFARRPEGAVISLTNPFVALPHLACAAYESPLTHADERYWPGLLDDAVRELVLDDHLRLRPRGRGSMREPTAVWAGRGWPSGGVGLRGSSADVVHIVLPDGTLVGTADFERAGQLVHPGAIYLHRGRTYRVATLDLDDHVAVVEPHPASEHTQPRTETDIAILTTDAERTVGASTLALGSVRVSSRVVGYRRIDTFSGELIANEELHLPPTVLTTRAFWYVVDPDLLLAAGLAPADWPGALHAAEHAAIGLLPLFTICDRWDVGGVSTALQADTGRPTIVIYDAYEGGAGVAELGFEAADRHLRATLDVIESCPCEGGCPSCVQSPKCGNGNEPLDKAGAAALLRAVLGADPATPGTPAPATRGWPG
jgi:DEAD/DEAH box helicase domain-containing protein